MHLSCNLLLIAGLKSPPNIFKLFLDLQGKIIPSNTTAILERVSKRKNKLRQGQKMNAVQKNKRAYHTARKKLISGQEQWKIHLPLK